MRQIADDRRPIKALTNERHGCGFAHVGSGGVTKIVAYKEPGQGAAVPWLAVYKGQECAARISAEHVAIYYETEADDAF